MIPEWRESFKKSPKSRVVTSLLPMAYSKRNLAAAVVARGKNRYTIPFAHKGIKPPPQVLDREGIRAAFLMFVVRKDTRCRPTRIFPPNRPRSEDAPPDDIPPDVQPLMRRRRSALEAVDRSLHRGRAEEQLSGLLDERDRQPGPARRARRAEALAAANPGRHERPEPDAGGRRGSNAPRSPATPAATTIRTARA